MEFEESKGREEGEGGIFVRRAWTTQENDYILMQGLGAKTGLAVCVAELKHRIWFRSTGSFLEQTTKSYEVLFESRLWGG
jgi:hypothetical protein